MESTARPAPPTLIVLRYGDPIVDALRAAGQGPLVVLRVLPPVTGCVPGGLPGGPGESTEPLQRAVRARLAELTAGRRPVPRLVVRFGDLVEHARSTVAEVRPARVVCVPDLARRLARAVAVPVVGAEDAVVVRGRGSVSGALGFLRRGLHHHEDAKVSALRAVALLGGVETRDLRRLAALLDCVEVGPGYVLVAEGRRNETLWLLLAGSARRSIGGREVGRLGAPALVGGPSIVYDRPAIATVTALEPVKALVAGRAQFRDITAIDAVALRLKAATADRLSDYLSAGDRPRPRGAPNGRRVLA
jgi:hypothetical protein